MSEVTIVIPVWNQLEFTKETIDSIVKYTPKGDYDLVVIDNGSDEETRDYLIDLASRNVIQHLYRSETNVGWIKACNIGVEINKSHFKNEFVLFANNDILVQKDWLFKMESIFIDTKVGAVGPISNYVAGLQSIQYNMYGLKKEEVNVLIGFFFMVRQSVLDIIGPMDESFGLGGGDDLDYSIRIREAGFKLMIDRLTYIHHYGSKSIKKLADDEGKSYETYHQEKDALIIKKWGLGKFAALKDVGERLSICYAIPMNSDHPHRKFMKSFFIMIRPGKTHYVDAPRINIAEARNLLAQKSVELKATHTMFIDDDMVWYNQDIMEKLLDHDVDIVSTMIYTRRQPYKPAIYRFNTDKTELVCCEGIEGTGLQEVDAVGGAFLLIKNEVFKKLQLPYFVYGDTSFDIYKDKGGVGEDLSFSLRAKQAGFKVWCDTNLEVKHLGEQVEIGGEQYKEFAENKYLKFDDRKL